MIRRAPIIRLARSPDFDPPDMEGARAFIEGIEGRIRQAMQWLQEDDPSSFNVSEVVWTTDYEGEVARQSGQTGYQAQRNGVVGVAKTIRKDGGAVIVINLRAYPLDEPIQQLFLCLHEGLHARHHRYFDLEALNALPQTAWRTRGIAESLLDEYACDREAYRVLVARGDPSRTDILGPLRAFNADVLKTVTSGETNAKTIEVHARYEKLYETQGDLTTEQWGGLARDIHNLIYDYWSSAVHALAFFDHFEPSRLDVQAWDHNTLAASRLISVVREKFQSKSFDATSAMSIVATVFEEFGLKLESDPVGGEHVFPLQVTLHR